MFLFLTVLWTWVLLGIMMVSGRHYLQFPWSILMLLGGIGPMAAACICIALGRWDKSLDVSVMRFLLRCFNPRTLSLKGFMLTIGLLLVFVMLPLLFDLPTVRQQGLIKPGFSAFIVVGFIFGALEEIGLRGYGQESLQKRMNSLAASLVIGVFWAFWHLPLFFIEGTYQASLGVGTYEFWLFFVSLIITSPLYGWLYNITADVSPVITIILHPGVTLAVLGVSKFLGKRGGYPDDSVTSN